MIDVHQNHRISESTHRIMNPLTPERLMLVGEICGLGSVSLLCQPGVSQMCTTRVATTAGGVPPARNRYPSSVVLETAVTVTRPKAGSTADISPWAADRVVTPASLQ